MGSKQSPPEAEDIEQTITSISERIQKIQRNRENIWCFVLSSFPSAVNYLKRDVRLINTSQTSEHVHEAVCLSIFSCHSSFVLFQSFQIKVSEQFVRKNTFLLPEAFLELTIQELLFQALSFPTRILLKPSFASSDQSTQQHKFFNSANKRRIGAVSKHHRRRNKFR
jgi:hypothetical protein